MNQPLVALDIIDRFINDVSFADVPLPTADYYTTLPISANNKYMFYNSSGLADYTSHLADSGALAGFVVGTVFAAVVATVVLSARGLVSKRAGGGAYVEIGEVPESSSLL